MSNEVSQQVLAMVSEIVRAMGLKLDASVEPLEDGLRVDLAGEDSGVLLRRKAEALDAIQHLVNTAYRRLLPGGHRVVIDCQNYRRQHDQELREIARFLIDKAKSTGAPQELGPLNSYARRLVHLEVAAVEGVASESLGDGALKLVVISPS